MLITLWIAVQVSGCDSEKKNLEATEVCDAACRVAGAVATWKQDRKLGMEAVAALPTPEEQLVAARTLLEAGQVEDGALCPFLGDRAAREYCLNLSMRAHLFEPTRPQAAHRSRDAGGPTDTELLPSRVTGTDANVAPRAPAACDAGDHVAACAHREALSFANEGDLKSASSLCASISSPKLRSECRFASADRAVGRYGDAAIDDAADLCLAAGEFIAHCLAHTVASLARRAPPATAPAADWAPVMARANQLRDALADTETALADQAVGRLYAETMVVAYHRAPHLDGRPLDVLPPVASQAVRDALAWELVSRGTIDLQSGLDVAVAELAGAEARRGPVAAGLPVGHLPVVRDQVGLDERETLSHPMGWWRGAARRPVSEQTDVDRILSVIEAIGALHGPKAPVLDEALHHDARIVMWSAARLSGRPEMLGPAPSPSEVLTAPQ